MANEITEADIKTTERVLKHIATSGGYHFNLVDYYEVCSRTTNIKRWFDGLPCEQSATTSKEKAAKVAASLLGNHDNAIEYFGSSYRLASQSSVDGNPDLGFKVWCVYRFIPRNEPVKVVGEDKLCTDKRSAAIAFADWLEKHPYGG